MPQSTSSFLPAASTRYFEPVTVPAAPRNVSFAISLAVVLSSMPRSTLPQTPVLKQNSRTCRSARNNRGEPNRLAPCYSYSFSAESDTNERQTDAHHAFLSHLRASSAPRPDAHLYCSSGRRSSSNDRSIF